MYYQDFSGWSSLGKTMFEPFFEVQRVVTPLMERLTRENVTLWSDSTSAAIHYAQSLNKNTKVEDQIKAQMGYFTEQGEKCLQYSQNVLKILEDGLREYNDLAGDKLSTTFAEQESAPQKRQRS